MTKAIIERTEYFQEVNEFVRWTTASTPNRFRRDDETPEEYTEMLNTVILKDFYAAVDWLLTQGYDEYHELISRTINPAQGNPFHALREYRVLRNGHYKHISIHQYFWGGCCITERNY